MTQHYYLITVGRDRSPRHRGGFIIKYRGGNYVYVYNCRSPHRKSRTFILYFCKIVPSPPSLQTDLIGAVIKLYLLIIRIVKMETRPETGPVRSTQSSRFSFNTFQFPVDFILKGPNSVCCLAEQIFCQTCRKIFCEMRVFCIVNANLYLNGTDHGRTDRRDYIWPDQNRAKCKNKRLTGL